MAKGDAFWRREEQKSALKDAEAEGRVADSMEVRKAIMQRFDSGEITLDEAQAELAEIKRNAKRQGKITRAQAYRGY